MQNAAQAPSFRGAVPGLGRNFDINVKFLREGSVIAIVDLAGAAFQLGQAGDQQRVECLDAAHDPPPSAR
jgi:hypothetical protein